MAKAKGSLPNSQPRMLTAQTSATQSQHLHCLSVTALTAKPDAKVLSGAVMPHTGYQMITGPPSPEQYNVEQCILAILPLSK